ncbi:MAG: hypothetical protein A2293_04665 [Elusimicrobia bacterium RIFOXYB2_FULL_49_7]|nr:MAG: hypothetical protein A2293_04665 [Elusimicrobia bacterium RIFOXYB2_FULL_49_7]
MRFVVVYLVMTLLFWSCASTSIEGDAGVSKENRKSDMTKWFSDFSSFSSAEAALVPVLQYLQIDSLGQAQTAAFNAKSPEDMQTFPGAKKYHIYRLTDCQVYAASCLVKRGMPVLIEWLQEDHNRYSVIYDTKIVDNPVTIGENSNKTHPEVVYLQYTINKPLHTVKQMCKKRLDNNQIDFTPDLLDRDGKANYDNALRSQYDTFIQNANSYDVKWEVTLYKYQHIFISGVWVVTPVTMTERALTKEIQAALDDKDMSYTVPKIKQIL